TAYLSFIFSVFLPDGKPGEPFLASPSGLHSLRTVSALRLPSSNFALREAKRHCSIVNPATVVHEDISSDNTDDRGNVHLVIRIIYGGEIERRYVVVFNLPVANPQ